jgi:hypothetical protein
MSVLHTSQRTLFAAATLTHRLVIPLLNAALSQRVPSQNLFETCGFVASYYKQHCTFLQSGHLKWYMQHHSLAQIDR